MWYKNNYRRHLCDMHVNDRNDEFLSKFSPEEYFENLKTAKVTSAMLYAQSHAGLCYYPTKSGKMHNAFNGREDMMKQLVDKCHSNEIAVTIYYSFIYNICEALKHPDWKMVNPDDIEKLNELENGNQAFTSASTDRYRKCCPNNPEYRNFVSEQIKEMCEYFDFDDMSVCIINHMIEYIGIYYTLRSKFNAHNETYTNYIGCVNTTQLMVKNNISCGITGGFHDISKYNVLIAPCLTEEDKYDYERIIDYVKNGGSLYISGDDCKGLLKEFFNAEITGRTKERVVYIAPDEEKDVSTAFGWFNKKYPLQFDGTAPIVSGINKDNVIATVTLPYTVQDTSNFASIHSDSPGVSTDIPAMALTTYGKGKVLWSALPIENMETPHQYSEVFIVLLRLGFREPFAVRQKELSSTLMTTMFSVRNAEVSTRDGFLPQLSPKTVPTLPKMRA